MFDCTRVVDTPTPTQPSINESGEWERVYARIQALEKELEDCKQLGRQLKRHVFKTMVFDTLRKRFCVNEPIYATWADVVGAVTQCVSFEGEKACIYIIYRTRQDALGFTYGTDQIWVPVPMRDGHVSWMEANQVVEFDVELDACCLFFMTDTRPPPCMMECSPHIATFVFGPTTNHL